MAKLSRKELRREMKEVILPVMNHLRELTDKGKITQAIEYQHRGTTLQAQFHANDKGLTVYIMYWYGVTIAFEITTQQLANVITGDIDQLASRFVERNEQVITRVYRGKPTLH